MTETLSIKTWVNEDGTRYYRMHGSGEISDQFTSWMIGIPVMNRNTSHPFISWAFTRPQDDALFKLFWWDYTKEETIGDAMQRLLGEAIQEEIDSEILSKVRVLK